MATQTERVEAILTARDLNYSSTFRAAEKAKEKFVRSWEESATALKNTGTKMTVALTAPLVAFLTKAVETAGEMQAMDAQFEQVFGDMQGAAQTSIDRMAEDFGMLPNRIKPAYTVLTSQFRGLGASTEEAMGRAADAVNLAADAGAFFDVSMESAQSSLNSFVKGNYEGGEAIGLFAKETQLASWAAEDLGLEWDKLGEKDKQFARLEYAQAMYDLAGVTGQASRESGELANQVGNLKQSFQEMLAAIGEPILNPVLGGMQRLTEAVRGAADWYSGLSDSAQSVIDVFGAYAIGIGPAMSVVGKLGETITNLKNRLNLAKEAGTGLAGALGGTGKFALVMAAIAVGKAIWDFVRNLDNAKNNMRKLREEAEQSSKAYETSTSRIIAQKEAADKLYRELEQLNNQTSLTNEEQARMRQLVSELNALYPELGLEIDKVTNRVKDLTGQYERQTRAIVEKQLAEADDAAFADHIKQKITATEQLMKAEQKRDDELARFNITYEEYLALQERVNQAYESGELAVFGVSDAEKQLQELRGNVDLAYLEGVMAKYVEDSTIAQNTLDDLTAQEEARQERHAEITRRLLGDYESLEVARESNTASAQAAVAAAVENDVTWADLSHREQARYEQSKLYMGDEAAAREAQQANLQAFLNRRAEDLQHDISVLQQYYNDVTSATQENLRVMQAFGTTEVDIRKATASEIARLNIQQIEGYRNYATNMQELQTRVSEDVYNQLRELGPEAASLIQEYNRMTDDELAQHAQIWQDKHDLAAQFAMDAIEPIPGYTAETLSEVVAEIDAKKDAMNTVSRQLGEEVGRGLRTGTSSATSAGAAIGDGAIAGLNSRRGALATAAANFANTITSRIRAIMQVQSPSRVMKRLFGMIGEGGVIGLRLMVGDMQRAADDFIAPLTGLDTESVLSGFDTTLPSTVTDGEAPGNPAVIYLQLGTQTLRAFVADISSEQGRVEQLEAVYGV